MFKPLFDRFRGKTSKYTVLARYYVGSWMKRFTVEGYSAYDAARNFDNIGHKDWIRVSGATLIEE